MQIGKVYVSKTYSLFHEFVFGICIDVSNHFHDEEINELVIGIKFLMWGFDIQINKQKILKEKTNYNYD